MKVSDFALDYSDGGCFSCCEDEIMNNQDRCKVGSIITCEHCGSRLCLTNKNGKLVWCGVRK
jgi:hypothetical protein